MDGNFILFYLFIYFFTVAAGEVGRRARSALRPTPRAAEPRLTAGCGQKAAGGRRAGTRVLDGNFRTENSARKWYSPVRGKVDTPFSLILFPCEGTSIRVIFLA